MSSRLLLAVMLCIVYITVAEAGPGYGYGSQMTLYEYPGKNGQSYHVTINKCVNLNSWGGLASSAYTHDTCVKLYSQKFCSGNYVYLKPGRAYYNLNDMGFDKRAYSAGSCDDN